MCLEGHSAGVISDELLTHTYTRDVSKAFDIAVVLHALPTHTYARDVSTILLIDVVVASDAPNSYLRAGCVKIPTRAI